MRLVSYPVSADFEILVWCQAFESAMWAMVVVEVLEGIDVLGDFVDHSWQIDGCVEFVSPCVIASLDGAPRTASPARWSNDPAKHPATHRNDVLLPELPPDGAVERACRIDFIDRNRLQRVGRTSLAPVFDTKRLGADHDVGSRRTNGDCRQSDPPSALSRPHGTCNAGSHASIGAGWFDLATYPV